jgi:ribose transport system permease protein
MKTEALRILRRWMERPEGRALFALAFIVAIGCAFNANDAFFRWGTHRDMLRQVSVYGIIACGMTLVIVVGGIDLSVGSVLGLCAVVFAQLSLHLGQPAVVVVPAVLAVGAAAGLLSGAAVARFRIQPFIATLAMMVFARGFAKWLSGGEKISRAIQQPDGSFTYVDLPRIFERLDGKVWGGNLAVVTLVFLGCVALSWVVLTRLRYGRYLYATGGNEEAARLSGVPVRRAKLLAYGLSGVFAAVAGMCQAAQEQQGDPEAGSSYELTAIAIAVIGGNSLAGGRGGIGLTLLGAMTIGYLEKILSINAVAESSRLMLTGVIILAAVLLQRRRTE